MDYGTRVLYSVVIVKLRHCLIGNINFPTDLMGLLCGKNMHKLSDFKDVIIGIIIYLATSTRILRKIVSDLTISILTICGSMWD